MGALRARILPVGGAFHSPLMAPAKDELAPVIETTVFAPPVIALVSSVTGAAVTNMADYRAVLLGQITNPVHWHPAVEKLGALGAGTFVEVGPGHVLSGLGRQTLAHHLHLTAEEALRHGGASNAPFAASSAQGRT